MKQLDWEILVDYLTGSAGAEDIRKFEAWLDADPENREYFESLKKIWQAGKTEIPEPDTEAALKRVLNRIENSRTTAPVYNINERKTKPDFVFVFASRFFKAAAVVFFILGAIYFYNIITSEINNAEITKTFAALDSLTLSDGSVVIADSGSKLGYLKDFPRLGERVVNLSGEAFFRISPNKKSPFKVKTKNGIVTVLGTQFNVRAWDSEDKSVVAVEKGRVSLQSAGNQSEHNTVILTAGQMSSVSAEGIPSPPAEIDVNSLKSWMNREIYFRNVPLKNVIAQLERWYNIKINVAKPGLLDNYMTVFIQNKPIEENIKLICSIFGLEYKIGDNSIELSASTK